MYKYKLILIFCLALIAISVSGCETTVISPQTNMQENYQSKEINTDKNVGISKKNINKEKIEDSSYNKSVKIGLMLPLSGEHYRIGRSLLNAAQMALEKINGNNLIVYIADTGDDRQLLENLYFLINKEIDVLIGPVFTDKIIKIKDILIENEIITISLSNNSELIENRFHAFGLTLEDEINELLVYSLARNFKRYAVVTPDNNYGRRVKKYIEKFNSINNQLKFKFIIYDEESPDFYEVSKLISDFENRKIKLEYEIELLKKADSIENLEKLKELEKLDTYGELDFEAILLLTQNFNELSNLSSILPYYDVDPKKIQYMGNSLWSKDQALKEPGLENGYFTARNIDSRKIFETTYAQIFKDKPHSLATYTYDLIGLISKILSINNNFEIQLLYSDKGFIGTDGWFRIHENGKVSRKPNIYKIKNQKFKIIK